MASYSVARAKHATLSGTTADDISFTERYWTLRVINRHATELLYFNYNTSTVPVAGADDTHLVTGNGSTTLRSRGFINIVRVVGNGNNYDVEIA